MSRVLIVGAHYDDAELGAGGTAARIASRGGKVYKLTLTDNVTKSPHLKLDIDHKSSAGASREVCRLLGVEEIEFEPVECCQLYYNTEIMQRVENIIFTYEIDTVFMHFQDDYNQDHREAYRVCVTAARYCKNLLCYQSNAYILPTPYYPSVFSDITEFAEKKLQALKLYGNQHNRFNKLFETTMEQNKTWGYAHRVGYAEAFHPIKTELQI